MPNCGTSARSALFEDVGEAALRDFQLHLKLKLIHRVLGESRDRRSGGGPVQGLECLPIGRTQNSVVNDELGRLIDVVPLQVNGGLGDAADSAGNAGCSSTRGNDGARSKKSKTVKKGKIKNTGNEGDEDKKGLQDDEVRKDK